MNSMCAQCHGDPNLFSGKVRAALAELYPLDQATGFNNGELRGAFTVKVDWPQGRETMDSLWAANCAPHESTGEGE
jgi:hypothetical protein